MPSLATFHDVVKRFRAGTAVAGLSFDIPEGSVTGLLGPNGAGKTTSIRILLGLARPDAGEVSLLGARPRTSAFAPALRQVGALIEGPAIYSRASARDNMRIEVAARGLDVGTAAVDDLLAFVGLADRAGTRAGGFSLGMKQRLGLAMALIGRPRLVVLDEPTNGLDPAGIVEIRELIARLPERGTTVLVSSHLLSEVQLMCDRAAIIDHGRLVAEGSMDELLAHQAPGGYVVRVDAGDRGRAHEILVGAGMAVTESADGAFAVTGAIDGGSQLNRLLAQGGVYAGELRGSAASLEDVFLSLTGGPADAATAPPPPPPPGAAR